MVRVTAASGLQAARARRHRGPTRSGTSNPQQPPLDVVRILGLEQADRIFRTRSGKCAATQVEGAHEREVVAAEPTTDETSGRKCRGALSTTLAELEGKGQPRLARGRTLSPRLSRRCVLQPPLFHSPPTGPFADAVCEFRSSRRVPPSGPALRTARSQVASRSGILSTRPGGWALLRCTAMDLRQPAVACITWSRWVWASAPRGRRGSRDEGHPGSRGW
jgi:hypothetical protein